MLTWSNHREIWILSQSRPRKNLISEITRESVNNCGVKRKLNQETINLYITEKKSQKRPIRFHYQLVPKPALVAPPNYTFCTTNDLARYHLPTLREWLNSQS